MACDKKADTTPLVSAGNLSSLLVWTNETVKELNSKSGDLKKLQLDAVAYLWELCYDLLLARADNVLTSPGFETLGLQMNRKRKREDEQV